MKPAPTLIVAVIAAALAAGACSGGNGASPTPPARTAAGPTATSGASRPVTLSGTLTLDGAPLDAPFLGARVTRDGLPAACQDEIPAVSGGRYRITVAAESEVRGCGAAGAEIVLWTFVGDRYLFSTEALPWPGDGASVTFDASFSSSDPLGASLPVTEFKGHLFDTRGNELPAGTIVEAFAGRTRCGVTSLRPYDVTEGYFTLVVAGPELVPACASGAPLTFHLDGAPAKEVAVNDLQGGSSGHELDLTKQ